MKVWLAVLLLGLSLPLAAAQRDLDALIEQVRHDLVSERARNQEREARFVAERDLRQTRVDDVEQELGAAKQTAEAQLEQFAGNQAEIEHLRAQLKAQSGELDALFAALRGEAAELDARLADSMLAAQFPTRRELLRELQDPERLPDSERLGRLWLMLLQEMAESGRVTSPRAPVIGPDGVQQERTIQRIGPFTAVADGRFLRWLPDAKAFVTLARRPDGFSPAEVGSWSKAPAGEVRPMLVDPSHGELLGMTSRTPDLWQRLQQGGAVGYVILALAVLAVLLILERGLFLTWIGAAMGRAEQAGKGPLGRIAAAGKQYASLPLEALELHLDEAVANEARRLVRRLPTIAVLAAVAPLLGLLGTVTGMIETFQSITLFGTGDPRLMSSGISEALITTALGLVVAIPVLLAHSLLKGKANALIARLDQAATHQLAVAAEGRKP